MWTNHHTIWVNYNDLTATSLESWLTRGIIPKWPYFRLVKYYNLPRYNMFHIPFCQTFHRSCLYHFIPFFPFHLFSWWSSPRMWQKTPTLTRPGTAQEEGTHRPVSHEAQQGRLITWFLDIFGIFKFKKTTRIAIFYLGEMMINQYLVGGLEMFGTWNLFFHNYIGNVIIPTDEVIFFRGVGIPPTRNDFWDFQI